MPRLIHSIKIFAMIHRSSAITEIMNLILYLPLVDKIIGSSCCCFAMLHQ